MFQSRPEGWIGVFAGSILASQGLCLTHMHLKSSNVQAYYSLNKPEHQAVTGTWGSLKHLFLKLETLSSDPLWTSLCFSNQLVPFIWELYTLLYYILSFLVLFNLGHFFKKVTSGILVLL